MVLKVLSLSEDGLITASVLANWSRKRQGPVHASSSAEDVPASKCIKGVHPSSKGKAAAQEGAPSQDMPESSTLRLPHLDSSVSQLVLHSPLYAPLLSSPEQQSGVAL